MYVNEFARRLGLPPSKVRYYDRSGMYQSRRGDNNYRDFTDLDALDAYLAQSLRSIDLSMEESLQAIQVCDRDQLHRLLSGRIAALEAELARAQAKLDRLEQLRNYTSGHIAEGQVFSGLGRRKLAVYSVCTFGKYAKTSEEALEIAAVLANSMPYTYIALTIPEESFLGEEEELSVGVGLGILEEFMERCGLTPSPVMDYFSDGPHLVIFMEHEDVFSLTRSDFRPLFDEAKNRGLQLYGNAVGRISYSYEKNGRRRYGFSVRCQVKPL